MYPIKLGPGLHIHQAWGLLVYPPGGLCHPSQCHDAGKGEEQQCNGADERLVY